MATHKEIRRIGRWVLQRSGFLFMLSLGACSKSDPLPNPPAPQPAALPEKKVTPLPVLTTPCNGPDLFREMHLTLPESQSRPVLLSLRAAWDPASKEDDDILATLLNGNGIRFQSLGWEAEDNQGQFLDSSSLLRKNSARSLGIRAIPTRFLIDTQGRLRGLYPGFVSHAQLQDDLLQLEAEETGEL